MFLDVDLRSWVSCVMPKRLLMNAVASAHGETVGFPVDCWLAHGCLLGSSCLDIHRSQVDLKDVPMSHTSEV